MFGISLVLVEPRARRSHRRRPRPSDVHGGRPRAGRAVDAALAGVGGRLRPAAHGLHDVDRRRAHGRRRGRLDDHVQRRPAPARGHGGVRPLAPAGAAPAHLHRLPARQPLPHRDDARDVHAGGVHHRHRHRELRLVHPRLLRREGVRRRLRRPRHHARHGADRRPAGDAAADARRGRRATSPSSAASRCCPPQATQVGTGRELEDYPLLGFDRVVPRPHDVRLRRARDAATPTPHRSGPRWPARRTSRWSTPRSCPAATTSTSRCCRATSASPASTTTTARSRPFQLRVRDPQTGTEATVTVIGVLAETVPARDGGHLDVAGDARRRLPRAGAADGALPVDRAGRRPRRGRGRARVRVPRGGHGGGVVPAHRRRGDRRVADLQPHDRGLHGARTGGRRRRARRHQRARRRRAPPADRRAARPRASGAAWSRRCSCSSRRSSP